MQNDYNPQYELTIETHEGLKLSHPLNDDEVRVIRMMGVSATPRKNLLKNFLQSVRNQPEEKFSHIQNWIESILTSTHTKFFTVQIENLKQNSDVSPKSELNIKFESLMVKDLEDFVWNENFELYDNNTTQLCWLTFLMTRESITLDNHCMIDQTWFMKGTRVADLIKHAEGVYKAEAIAQNSKIQFGTDDNKTWWAHEVPFFGTVQLDQIEEHGLTEWDIYFNDCWQGPFSSKSKAIQHLEECIAEKRKEAKDAESCAE